jgi:hypothetical protein
MAGRDPAGPEAYVLYIHTHAISISLDVKSPTALAYALYFRGQYDRVDSVKLLVVNGSRSFRPMDGCCWIPSFADGLESVGAAQIIRPTKVIEGIEPKYCPTKLLKTHE